MEPPDKNNRQFMSTASVFSDDPSEDERKLKAELFESMRRLYARVGGQALRDSLAHSMMLCADAQLRAGYDDQRIELDAYLAALDGEDKVVAEPDDFIASPDITDIQARAIAETVTTSAHGDKKPKH